MAAPTFSEGQQRTLHQLYLRQHLQPQDCVTALNTKFGTAFTVEQVRRFVVAKGWSARRKKIVKKEQELSLPSDNKIAHQLAAKQQTIMEKFAQGTEAGADRALAMVAQAQTPREMASAAAAAKSLITTFRLVSGMENASTRPVGQPIFQFNFQAQKDAPRTSNTPQPVEVVASPADVGDGDDDPNCAG